jgi:hypothetical protein
MRHADLSTTLRIYTHVMKHRREGVAERLDEALWGDSERHSTWEVSEKRAEREGGEAVIDGHPDRGFGSSKR